MSIQKRTKLVPWMAGLALMGLVALTTLPSLAAPSGTKFYLFGVSTSTTTQSNTVVAGAVNQVLYVKVTNTSPKQSSSNFSSVSVVVPSQFTIVGKPPDRRLQYKRRQLCCDGNNW